MDVVSIIKLEKVRALKIDNIDTKKSLLIVVCWTVLTTVPKLTQKFLVCSYT